MVSIVIPIFNEALGISDFLSELELELRRETDSIEVIFVDDCSVDESVTILNKFVEESRFTPNIVLKIMQNPTNLGYGASIKRGLRAAKHDSCAIIDSDTTYAFHELLSLIRIFNKNSHAMVVGARTGKFYQGTFTKRILRILLKGIVEYMANRNIPDINSGVRVFDKKLALQDLRLLSDRFSFTTSITLVFMLKGAIVDYIPVAYRKRSGGSKIRLFSDSVRTLGLILAVSFYFNPLKVLYPITTLLTFISFSFFLTSLFLMSGLFLISAFVFFLSALVILSIGLLAHLLSLNLQK
jgi:glycosyltransferase involved in cell wall biosynthesis